MFFVNQAFDRYCRAVAEPSATVVQDAAAITAA